MNNLKMNSRFEVLNTEKKDPKKREHESDKRRKPEVNKRREEPEINKKEIKNTNQFIKNSITSPKVIAINDLSSFPDLISSNKKEDVSYKIEQKSFMDIVQYQKEEEKVEEEEEQLPEGWIVLKKGKPYIKKEELKEEVFVDPNIIFNRLVDSHEKWKSDYIKTWGIEAYERECLFQNYDEYFYDSEE
jgi:hypothetical protein